MSEAEDYTQSEDRSTSDSEVALALDDLVKRFGGITAVDGASFEVERGTLTGLIGPNGAGKSTTFNLITGVYQPDEGSVRFLDEDITDLRPFETSNRGLVRTFQIAREFENMTVLENMMVAPKGQSGEAAWRSALPGTRASVQEEEVETFERAWEFLEFFEIEHLALENAGNLSGGQRKLLELARALMLEPQMLLLDEPFAGVNPTLQNQLINHLHSLREQGYTILLIEHDMDLIMEHCESLIVMHQGKTLVHGKPEDIKSDERVIEAYLGGDI